jgi:tetratricopeptide (TPR) repeat protein
MGRRGWIVILLVGVVTGAAGWYGWRRYTAPVPPLVVRDGIDPELAEAIQTARRKIQADPYSAPCWGDLGKLLRAAQLYPEAVACFAQAEKLDPKNPRWPYMQGEALRTGDTRAAVPPLQRAVALSGNTDTIAPFLRLAEVCLTLGQNNEAEEQLRRALEIEPDEPAVHYNLGLLALAREDLSASLDHLKRCEYSPITKRKACIQLAAVYRRMGRTQDADNYSRKADTLPPDRNWIDPFLSDVLPVGRRARLEEVSSLEKRGDYRSAAEQLSVLIQEKPEYRLYVGLGRNLYQAGDFDGAERALRSAVALEPEKPAGHHELSRLLWSQADKLERTNPERARAKYEEAADRARQALASRPDHPMTYVILGMSLRRLGKRQEALDEFRKAIQCDPNLTEGHLYLGETLAELGQVAEARASLERAKELSPDNANVQAALAKLKIK